jgi:hypothetical protein
MSYPLALPPVSAFTKSRTWAAKYATAIGAWYPTWAPGDTRGMTVKSVKMWQQGTCS